MNRRAPGKNLDHRLKMRAGLFFDLGHCFSESVSLQDLLRSGIETILMLVLSDSWMGCRI
jgi:hypothetical protein